VYPEPVWPKVNAPVLSFGAALVESVGRSGRSQFLQRFPVFLVTITAASRPSTFWTVGAQVGWEVTVAGLKLRDIGPIDCTLAFSSFSALPEPEPM